jgi:probable HAF family extracellular repeat protein
MKSIVLGRIALTALIAVLAMPAQVIGQAQQSKPPGSAYYRVTDLGTLPGGTFSQATGITNHAVAGGSSTISDGTQHAVLWYKKSITDIGTPGLGGPDSAVFGVNESGQASGLAETPARDPNGEDFCGYGTFHTCLPFLWHNSVMTPLPTLGGNNGEAGEINSRGTVAGNVENTALDLTCPPGGPQVFEEKPVFWEHGHVKELDTFGSDPDGWAFGINENGQVVGASGVCAPLNPQTGVYIQSRHALLWDKRKPIYLGSLGGTGALGPGNFASEINNRGQVVGASDLPGDKTYHGFLWSEKTGILDLGTLLGDAASSALGINDDGNVVGVSLDADFNPRAFLRREGRMIDLNQLAPDSPLYLLIAHGINSSGEIIGFGVNSIGDVHAYLAIPCDRDDPDAQSCRDDRGRDVTERPRAVPDSIRELIRRQLGRRSYSGASH